MRLAPPPRTAPATSAAPRFWVPGTKARPTPVTMARAVPHLEELAFGLAIAVELLGGDGVQAGDVEVCDRPTLSVWRGFAYRAVRCLVFLGQWWKEYCFER